MRKFLLACCIIVAGWSMVQGQRLPVLGMASPLENDSLLYASGFRLIGPTVKATIGPSLTEKQFSDNLNQIKNGKCKVYMCNVLFPPTLKIAGPDVDEARVLSFLDTVLTRARAAKINNLMLGSGGARRLPEGFNREQASASFVQLARKMARRARAHKVTIMLENLNSTETNFLNTVKDAAAVVRRVNHPNFKLNADIYHMMVENESPQEIIRAGKLVACSEIAEKAERTLPGVVGEDFRPYLGALKAAGFTGPIIVEGRSENLRRDIPRAYQLLLNQLIDVYKP